MEQRHKMRYGSKLGCYSFINRNEVKIHAYTENISLVNRTSHSWKV